MVGVDSARLYVITVSEGIKGLDHSLANIKEDEYRLIEFDGPQWCKDWQFSGSRDGRCVFFATCIRHCLVLESRPNAVLNDSQQAMDLRMEDSSASCRR